MRAELGHRIPLSFCVASLSEFYSFEGKAGMPVANSAVAQ